MCSVRDFCLKKVLRNGAYSKTVLAKKISNNKEYVLKIIDKRNQNVSAINASMYVECNIMQSVKFEFLVRTEEHFADDSKIYVLYPYFACGDLLYLLNSQGKFSESEAKFYSSQLVLALEHLHNLEIVHRDLKPASVFLTGDGYIKLGDFGFCKYVKGRTYTFCGTPQYIAPEMVLCRGYAYAVDWWSLGVTIFELNDGLPPFDNSNEMEMFENIVMGRYTMPETFSADLHDLLDSLIQTDLSKRIGNLKDGANDIKEHMWFAEICWEDILNKIVKPPILPVCGHYSGAHLQAQELNCDIDALSKYFEWFE